MLKADGAVPDGHFRAGRVGNIRFFLQHLRNAVGRGKGNGDHGKNHGEHHQRHQNLRGVGEQRRQIAGGHAKCCTVSACDNGFCTNPRNQNHAGVHEELHNG